MIMWMIFNDLFFIPRMVSGILILILNLKLFEVTSERKFNVSCALTTRLFIVKKKEDIYSLSEKHKERKKIFFTSSDTKTKLKK